MLWTSYGEDRRRIDAGYSQGAWGPRSTPYHKLNEWKFIFARAHTFLVSQCMWTHLSFCSQISQLRHGVRILRSKCITQRWLFNQIICQKDPSSMVHVVFVDFAFATMLYDYKPGMDMPMAQDLYLLEGLLCRMLHEDLVRKHWLLPLEYEL